MKVRSVVSWFFFLAIFSTPAFGRGPQQQDKADAPIRDAGASNAGADSATPSKIDPIKEADIRRLLNLTGSADIGVQAMDGMEKNLRQFITSSLPPGEYREKLIDLFWEKFNAKLKGKISDLTAQAYDRVLSDEEIKGLIDFYSTPLGKKVISVLPKLTTEIQTEAQKLGETAGQQSMQEVN